MKLDITIGRAEMLLLALRTFTPETTGISYEAMMETCDNAELEGMTEEEWTEIHDGMVASLERYLEGPF